MAGRIPAPRPAQGTRYLENFTPIIMKTWFVLIIQTMACAAMGQSNTQSLTSKELVAQIEHEVFVTKSAEARRRIIDDVIASERLDLLATCFGSQFCMEDTFRRVVKIPKSTLRVRATITLLRTPSSFWPEDGTATRTIGGYDFASSGHLLVEPFISTMAELLPDEKLELRHVRSTRERQKLADRLEEALEKKYPAAKPSPLEIPSAVVAESGNPPSAISAAVIKPVPTASPQAQPNLPASDSAPKSGSRGSSTFWISAIAAVFAVGLWLVARKKA